MLMDGDDYDANEAQFLAATQPGEAQARAQRRQQLDCASSGIIQSIVLINFMCHRKLQVNFGPHINFVIGHNGSGKSAVLTGITICLGGKASSTNRASNLSGFIRAGEAAAEISLTLKNQGQDAYMPDQYGDAITIVRRIAKEGGSSGYKIKSADGKVVSTRRDDVTAICDHMQLQPDNPMIILSQDNARQFLSSSTPAQRYSVCSWAFLSLIY